MNGSFYLGFVCGSALMLVAWAMTLPPKAPPK